eukprot:m.187283 g.187283  ORF g.187283 m.187283 type:complete len:158 (-) comp53574_c0_seq15:1143-1616(-)
MISTKAATSSSTAFFESRAFTRKAHSSKISQKYALIYATCSSSTTLRERIYGIQVLSAATSALSSVSESSAHTTENAIPIETWLGDPTDKKLLSMLPLLFSLHSTQDVRSIFVLGLTLARKLRTTCTCSPLLQCSCTTGEIRASVKQKLHLHRAIQR